MPKRRLQVFISSTFVDLKEERQAAVSAILKAGHIPAGMELFTSGDETQWDIIKRWIDQSDVYMLILGGRYGSVHPDSGFGYTELEYDYAVSKGKPFFAVVINDAALEAKVKIYGTGIIELDNREKLRGFRGKVLGKISSFFSDVKDIRLAVHETLPVLQEQYNPPGWISGNEFVDNKPLFDELAGLNVENKILKAELAQLQTRSELKQGAEDVQNFKELRTALSHEKVDMSDLDMSGLSIDGEYPEEMTLLDFFFFARLYLVDGISNDIAWNSVHREWLEFLYYKICPRLQIYDIMEAQNTPNSPHLQSKLTIKGRQLLALMAQESALSELAAANQEE